MRPYMCPICVLICAPYVLTHANLNPKQDNYIYVLKLVPGGPAQLCENIKVDDVLYKVDGTNVSGMELDQVRTSSTHSPTIPCAPSRSTCQPNIQTTPNALSHNAFSHSTIHNTSLTLNQTPPPPPPLLMRSLSRDHNHMCICTHVYMYMCVYSYVHMNAYSCEYIPIHIYTYAHIHTGVHAGAGTRGYSHHSGVWACRRQVQDHALP